jgi:hypothetical protein
METLRPPSVHVVVALGAHGRWLARDRATTLATVDMKSVNRVGVV